MFPIYFNISRLTYNWLIKKTTDQLAIINKEESLVATLFIKYGISWLVEQFMAWIQIACVLSEGFTRNDASRNAALHLQLTLICPAR